MADSLEMRKTDISTCDNDNSWIKFKTTSIQEGSCVSENVEGEVSDQELADDGGIVLRYYSLEEKGVKVYLMAPPSPSWIELNRLSPIQKGDKQELKIEDSVVQCESAVTHIGNGEELFKSPSCNFETTQEAVFSEHIHGHILDKPLQLSHYTLSSVQSSVTNNCEFQNQKRKPFKCPSTSAIKMSTSSTNHKEKPFKCVHCTFACSRKNNLMRHLRTHSGEKPFKCTQCTFAFSSKANLKTHMLKHTGQKPFKCTQCTFACSRKGHLKTHMLKHTGQKPFKCTQCTSAFSRKGHLKTHMLKHTDEKPLKCTQCTFACRQGISLKIHMYKHTGEKPFKCTQCSFAFSTKGILKTHMLTHTDEKPFKCTQCTFACRQGIGLKIHMYKHTGEKPFKVHSKFFRLQYKV